MVWCARLLSGDRVRHAFYGRGATAGRAAPDGAGAVRRSAVRRRTAARGCARAGACCGTAARDHPTTDSPTTNVALRSRVAATCTVDGRVDRAARGIADVLRDRRRLISHGDTRVSRCG